MGWTPCMRHFLNIQTTLLDKVIRHRFEGERNKGRRRKTWMNSMNKDIIRPGINIRVALVYRWDGDNLHAPVSAKCLASLTDDNEAFSMTLQFGSSNLYNS